VVEYEERDREIEGWRDRVLVRTPDKSRGKSQRPRAKATDGQLGDRD
jgi:hypothetical protein